MPRLPSFDAEKPHHLNSAPIPHLNPYLSREHHHQYYKMGSSPRFREHRFALEDSHVFISINRHQDQLPAANYSLQRHH